MKKKYSNDVLFKNINEQLRGMKTRLQEIIKSFYAVSQFMIELEEITGIYGETILLVKFIDESTIDQSSTKSVKLHFGRRMLVDFSNYLYESLEKGVISSQVIDA